MAARKLAMEVERTFKKVDEGVAAFEAIHDKILQTNNLSQKEKLEDSLKKEIKKLQRQRDQIKAWAQLNDIKDKKPLLDKRKLIEMQMERFKVVEKEMKTKAYSKEGLSAASKLDPKEKEKLECIDMVSKAVDDLERQVEGWEAEIESLQATTKKSKKDANKAERIAGLEENMERHKWHQGKLELLMRALENGTVDPEQVKELEESIRYYVDCNQEADFMEDDGIYDDLNLEEEEEAFNMGTEVDKVSSQDTQPVQEDTTEADGRPAAGPPAKSKGPSSSDVPTISARRPSNQLRSPLPALATLHSAPANAAPPPANMKPAPLPNRSSVEPLKYASAAAAAAATDKSGMGISPLPAPAVPVTSQQNPTQHNPGSGIASPPASRPMAANAAITNAQSQLSANRHDRLPARSPEVKTTLLSKAATLPQSEPHHASATPTVDKSVTRRTTAPAKKTTAADTGSRNKNATVPAPSTLTNRENDTAPIFHLPTGLQELLETFEATKQETADRNGHGQIDLHLLTASQRNRPMPVDAEKPRHYRPQHPYPYTPDHYPQEPLAIFDDNRLYNRLDTDTLFYSFYYRQGTYQQYLAAKALKAQSWRFHKQYQTWFQRHEEPKQITEDYEQGTYRFFDYESTWMNRRKQDFRFIYKFLEDDL